MHARTDQGEYRPDAIPYRELNAWFAVGRAKDVGSKEPVTVRVFDHEIVLFRDSKGALQALDAICPHLGAHLGGGTVVDDTIQCPFHQWRFGGDGRCVHVPFARNLPPNATTRRWHTVEQAGLIFVWHHVDGASPTYHLPDLEAEFGSMEGAAYFRLEGSSTVQDMLENSIDVGHFHTLHGIKLGAGFQEQAEARAFKAEGRRLHVEIHSSATFFGVDKDVHWSFDILGPSAFMARGQSVTPFDVLACHQPVSTRGVIGHFLVKPRLRWSVANAFLQPIIARRTRWEVEQDLAVWNHQRHAAKPVLSDADGPIVAYRKWMRQFYADRSTAASA